MSSESQEIDPKTFGDEELSESLGESHTEAEGLDPATQGDQSPKSKWRKMLMNTKPEKDLSSVESPWDPEGEGGPSRIYRGVMKMGDVDGMPAIGDILIGFAETIKKFELEGGKDEQSESEDSEPEETTERVSADGVDA